MVGLTQLLLATVLYIAYSIFNIMKTFSNKNIFHIWYDTQNLVHLKRRNMLKLQAPFSDQVLRKYSQDHVLVACAICSDAGYAQSRLKLTRFILILVENLFFSLSSSQKSCECEKQLVFGTCFPKEVAHWPFPFPHPYNMGKETH